MTKKEKVFQVVSQIPKGKVMTYLQIARISDSGPRAVGQYLHTNDNPRKYPCHRVVHADGSLATGYAFGGEENQKALLQVEGILFVKEKINLAKFGWLIP